MCKAINFTPIIIFGAIFVFIIVFAIWYTYSAIKDK